MLRITLVALPLLVGIAGITTASSCTITHVGEGEGEGEGAAGEGEGAAAGEGEGAAGEGEGTAASESACTTGNCCGDGNDNDNNGFTDCDDFDCAGDAACDVGTHSIQEITDGAVQLNRGVTVAAAVVTGVHLASSGNYTLYIQAPETADGQTYPDHSGVGIFIRGAEAAGFSDLTTGIVGGDCVTVTGTIGLFDGDFQLSTITAFSKTGGCAALPAPPVKNVSDVNDSGADGPALQNVVIEVDDVTCTTASTGTSGSFVVTAATGGATLFISGFLLSPAPAVTADTHFSKITGVLTEFDDTTTTPHTVRFNLDPRTADDMVP